MGNGRFSYQGVRQGGAQQAGQKQASVAVDEVGSKKREIA